MLMNQNKTPLFDAMKDYHKKNIIPFDVPGHKHGKGLREFGEYFGDTVLQLDVNSMKQLDNLSNPTSVIREAQELAAEAYWADSAFFLVNGTTSGVQSMIMSVCSPGDKIILPRNAHKSAINALILSGAKPVYIQPEINNDLGIAMGVSLQSVENAIARNTDAKAVFLINPTYYGATSDIKEIAKLCHKHGIALLVDQAHGAHFRFSKQLPVDAMEVGADMCAVSLHKTGGSLTQSSILLLKEGLVDQHIVKSILNLSQTTSASYLLMVSLDIARKNLAVNGNEILTDVLELSRDARIRINNIDGLYAFGKELIGTPGVYNFDETKLGINVCGLGLTGFEVYDILRDEYDIQMELADAYNVLGIISVGDTEESLDALVKALEDISVKYRKGKITKQHVVLQNPHVIVSPRNAFYSRKKIVKLEDAEGEISGEYIMAYPPGIPIVAPGEKISKEMIAYVKFLKIQKSVLTDTEDPNVEKIKVLGS